MKRIMIAIAMLLVATAAQARPHHHHRHHGYHHHHLAAPYASGRPHAWCGWYARLHLVSSDPGAAFNLARNWARWGRPARAGIGVMVVWVHHVGKIVGRDANGNWIVRSGNDGNRVRERPRSVARAIAFRA